MDKQQFGCPSATHAIELLHSRKRIEVLCVLRLGPIRLGKLSRLLPETSKKVLTAQLRSLESAGIVQRHDLSGTIRHVEYELVEGMRLPLHHLLAELESFGSAHTRESERRAE